MGGLFRELRVESRPRRVGGKKKERSSQRKSNPCVPPTAVPFLNKSLFNKSISTTSASKTPPKGAREALNSLPPAQHVVEGWEASPERAGARSCDS